MIKLRKYQKEAVSWLLENHKKNKTLLLADEMGLGKTIVSLDLINKYLAESPKSKFLVVAPSSLAVADNSKWFYEASRFFPETAICVIQKGMQLINKNATLFITSYGLIKKETIYRQFIEMEKLRLLVMDEAHYVKNYKSQVSTFMTSDKFIRLFDNILLVSGTIFSNNLEELYQYFRNYFIHTLPRKLISRYNFMFHFSERTYHNGFGIVHSGVKHTQELKGYLSNVMVRRLKKDVLKELPQLQIDYYPLLESKDVVDVLKKEEQIMQTLKDLGYSLEKLPKLGRSDIRFEDVMALRRSVGISKFKQVKDIIDFLMLEKNKIIISTVFKKTAHEFSEFIKKYYSTEVVTGSMEVSERQEVINDFYDNDKQLFICTGRSVNEGLDLLFTDTIVVLEIDYSYYNFVQLCARIHRIGQKSKKIQIICTVYGRGIDREIRQNIQNKESSFEKIMN